VIFHSNYLKCGLNIAKLLSEVHNVRFLKFCINNDIVPKHLYFLHRHNINLTHYKTHNRYEHLNHLHAMRTLRIELNDAFRNMHSLRAQIFYLVRKITQDILIYSYINNSFFKKQEQLLYHYYLHERQGINKKISWLIKKQVRDSVHKTKPIKYYCYVPNSTETEQNAKHFSFSSLT